MSRLGSFAGATVAAALAVTVLAAGPAEAARLGPIDTGPGPVGRAAGPTPSPAAGHHLMVDMATAPSSSTMQEWQAKSPYSAIGVYVDVNPSYDNRHDKVQSNLTPTWVDQVLARRWQILPIYVGLQSPCPTSSNAGRFKKISGNATTARSQGVSAATDAAGSVRALRLPATAPVVYDLEGYAPTTACTTAVQSFLAGWTSRLHQLGLRSGVYGSRSSTMTDVTSASQTAAYPIPDVIWEATDNGQANTTFSTPPPGMWEGRRLNQFYLGVNRTWGDVQLNVDESAVQDSVWDRTAPRLVAPQPPRATKHGRVRIGWRSVDASGVATYQVRIRHNGGRWKSPKDLRRTRQTVRAFALRPGERWCVQARATDRVGNTSAWSAPLCSTRFTDDRALRAGRGWTHVHGGYLGTGTRATRKGLTLRGKRVSGRHVAVILHGRGTVGVYIRGRLVGRVHGNGTKWITLPATRSGRIALRTETRSRVVVDGYAVTP
ncbi:hypothetical protein GCM10009798_26580 [Nocardioides panacihumi]|uniref:Fibronectin type-III domain-containing protein n=1 Tax=Nocardioides panacihumi TaxID=400774 RepID=A0ABN2R824_9ACTN